MNLLAPDVRANPYPFYAGLRRHAPVSQVDPGGLWAVARYDDVMTVLKNPRLFSSEGIRRTYRPDWIPDYPMADSMLVMDPPRHTRLRSLVSRAFGATVLTRLEPRLRELSHRLIAALPDGQPVDFVEDFSIRVPISALGELVGIPPSLHAQLKHWAEVMTRFTSVGPADLEPQERIRASVAEARHHFEQVLEERRREPRDDLMSDLLSAHVDGEALTQTELMGFMFLLLIGGLETTVHLLSASVLKLQEDPALMARLRAEPELIPRFIDEMLRHSGPVHGIVRLTTDDVELGGAHVPRGERLLLLMASANRDEARFLEPDRFDLERAGSQQLPFGHGAHFCLGAQLARMEARLALEALLARFARLTPGDEPARWNISLVMRGPIWPPLAAHTD
ncbi:cytochrome P450 [Archangium sp.]|uniref:cytochrome P450 n=1 Tax=Archangium sp. TaxID=1872627 RepID=UPI00389A71B2